MRGMAANRTAELGRLSARTFCLRPNSSSWTLCANGKSRDPHNQSVRYYVSEGAKQN